MSGIIVLIKTPTKYREFFPILFVKTTDFPIVFNLQLTLTVKSFNAGWGGGGGGGVGEGSPILRLSLYVFDFSRFGLK